MGVEVPFDEVNQIGQPEPPRSRWLGATPVARKCQGEYVVMSRQLRDRRHPHTPRTGHAMKQDERLAAADPMVAGRWAHQVRFIRSS